MKLFDLAASDTLLDYVDGLGYDPFHSRTRLFPVACCWPMGFSWSSAVAQDVMLFQTNAVGLDYSHLLADDKPSPNFAIVDECFAVCTDDVMHWSRSVGGARARLNSLDAQ